MCEPHWHLPPRFAVAGQGSACHVLIRQAMRLPYKYSVCLRNSYSLAGNRNENDFLAWIGNAQRRARVWIAPLQRLALLLTNSAHWLVVTGREVEAFVACVVNNLGCARWDESRRSDCRSCRWRWSILRNRCSLRRTIDTDAREDEKDGGRGQP